MMGREKDVRQVRLIDVQPLIGAPVVPPDTFYGQMAAWGRTLVTDDQFASLHEPRGRESVPPARVAKMMLVMYHDNVSEREAEEKCYATPHHLRQIMHTKHGLQTAAKSRQRLS